MRPSRTDPRILGYLGRALSLELSAVQLYSTQARLVTTWGLDQAAARLGAETREETGHVERIIARRSVSGLRPGDRAEDARANAGNLAKSGCQFQSREDK